MNKYGFFITPLTLFFCQFCLAASPWSTKGNTSLNIEDEMVRAQFAIAMDKTPSEPRLESYGMLKDGRFQHPKQAPSSHSSHPFKGQLDYWDQESYAKNIKVEAYYPIKVEPFHTWQNIDDVDGRRS